MRRIAHKLRLTPRQIGYEWGPRLMSRLRKRWVLLRHPHANIVFEGPVYLGPGFSLHLPFDANFIVGPGVEFRRNFRAELGAGATIEIGAGTIFTYDVLIQIGSKLTIGEHCGIGQATLIVGGSHKLDDFTLPPLHQGFELRDISIGNGVVAYSKNTITADVGERTVLGSGAIVTKPAPAYSLMIGAPARAIDYFGPEQAKEGG